MRIMQFDPAGSPNVLTAAMTVVLSITLGTSTPSKTTTMATTTTTAASFSVWFRPEPGLPRKRDMKAKKLNRLIGSDYDETWMSKTPMITAAVAAAAASSADGNSTGRPDDLLLPEQIPAQYQEILRAWLDRRSTCPVEYAWTDLGKSFWPRWIRQGRCGRTATASCSWPPGMSCLPSSVRVLNLLRWHCWLKNKNKRKNQGRTAAAAGAGRVTREGGRSRKKKKKDDKFRCLWIKVPYPVTEDCTCSCRKVDN